MRRKRECSAALAAMAILLAGCQTLHPARGAQRPRSTAYFSNWPAGASPREIGKRVAENFAARKLGWQADPRRKSVVYPEVVSWYGALTAAELLHDGDLQGRLIQKFDTMRTPEGARHIPEGAHVDSRVFGAVPLEIYLLSKDTSYRSLGLSFAD